METKIKRVSIAWFKRDLRVHANHSIFGQQTLVNMYCRFMLLNLDIGRNQMLPIVIINFYQNASPNCGMI